MKWISQRICIGEAWLDSLRITRKLILKDNLGKTSSSVVSILFGPYQVPEMIHCSSTPRGTCPKGVEQVRERHVLFVFIHCKLLNFELLLLL